MAGQIVAPQVGSTRVTRLTKVVGSAAPSVEIEKYPVLRNTGGAGISPNVTTIESEELTGTSVLGLRDQIRTQTLGEASYNFEFSPRTADLLHTNDALSATAPNIFTSGATWPAAVIASPNSYQVHIKGTTSNDGVYDVVSAVGAVLTVAEQTVVTEITGGGRTVDFSLFDPFSIILESFFQNNFTETGILYPGTKDNQVQIYDYFSDISQELGLGGSKPSAFNLTITAGEIVTGDTTLSGTVFSATTNYLNKSIQQPAQSVQFNFIGSTINPTLGVPQEVISNPTAFTVQVSPTGFITGNERTFNILSATADIITVSANPGLTTETIADAVLIFSGIHSQLISAIDNGNGTGRLVGFRVPPPDHIINNTGNIKYYVSVHNSDAVSPSKIDDGYYEIVNPVVYVVTTVPAETVGFNAAGNIITPTTPPPAFVIADPTECVIFVEGADNASNNGYHTILSATATTITVATALATAPTDAGVSVFYQRVEIIVKGVVESNIQMLKYIYYTAQSKIALYNQSGAPPDVNQAQAFVAGDRILVDINILADGQAKNYQDTANYGLLFQELALSGELTTESLLEITQTNPFIISPTDRRFNITFSYHLINNEPISFLMSDAEFGIRFRLNGVNGQAYVFEFPRCKSVTAAPGDAALGESMVGEWEIAALLTDVDIIPADEFGGVAYTVTDTVNALVYRNT